MTHPEEKLAELGLSVPEVATPVAAYVPALRSGNHVYTSGQLPMRAGELITTGKVGGEVSPEEAVECAQQCALNAIAAVKAPDRRPGRDQAGREGGLLRRLHARLHRPAAGRQRRLAPVRRGLRRRRACTRGRRSAYPCCRSTRRSRSRSSSRSERRPMERLPLPPQLVQQAAEYADGSRTAGRAARRGDGRAAAPVGRRVRRCTCCAGRPRWSSPPGCACSPAAASTRATSTTRWRGPGRPRPSGRAGSATDERTARALVCAAVRETFEESGVLLAGTADAVVADTTGADWEADRVALEARELAFTEFLDRRGLVLRTDLLGVWAGWLTPVFEPRRYRTWFFVALLPEGQVTRDVSTESSSVTWLPAMSAVSAVEAGDMFMLPPTYLTCLEVGQYADPAAVLGEAAGATGRHVHARGGAGGRRLRAVDAGPVRRAGGGAMSAGRAARSGTAASACSRRTPNMMTLDGTNTWVLREPDARRSVVIDPGPSIAAHLDAVAEAAGDVAVVLLTHHHADHSEAAREFAERVGCGVRALDPAYRLGSEGLGEGDVVDGRRPRAARGRDARAHRRLAVVRAAGRAARCSPATPCSAAAPPSSPTPTASSAPTSTRSTACTRWPRRTRSRTVWPGHGPVHRRRPRRPRLLHRPPSRAARAGRVGAGVAEARPTTPKASRPTSCPAGSSRSSTRTSTRCCGARPSCRCGPSWPTCRSVSRAGS